MTNKWMIPDPAAVWSAEDRARYWETLHRETDYDVVYSLTDDADLRHKIVRDVAPREPGRVLVPGCGTRTQLQRELVEALPLATIVCTDFPGVVSIAERRFSHERVEYVGGDLTTLDLDEFDAVVHVTSVVSDSDAENRSIVRNTADLLVPGGLFVGVFPTVYATLDVAYTTGETWRAEAIDLHRSSFTEPKQNVTQIFYTPLRLRRILLEGGLSQLRIELFFNDSEFLRSQGSLHYGLDDADAVLYHLYVVAETPR